MATQATGFQHNYNMIEDYALAVWPPVAQNVEYSFLTLQNPAGGTPVNELLTVSDQNQLLHFFRDPSAHSGWGQEQRLVDGAPDEPITKLIGFYQGESLFALAHYAASGGSDQVIGMQKTPQRGWAAMPMTSNLTNALGAMRQTAMFTDAAGNVIVYGVSENFNQPTFVMAAAPTSTSQQWALVWEAAAPSGATYRLLPGQGGGQITVMTLQGSTATFQGGSIVDGMFEWGSQPPISHDLGQGDIAAQQVFPLPSQSDDPGFLLLSAAGTLYRVEDYLTDQPSVTPMTGGAGQPAGAGQVAIGLDSENRWMVFAIETKTARLWLLRQSRGSAGSGGVVFNDWVTLGDELAALACPPVMTAGPELFFYNLQAQVCHMGQDIADGGSTWFTTQMAVPAAASANPTPTTTYTQELIAQNDQGLPVPSSPVTLYADRKAVVVANGLSYHIGPNDPVLVESDARGAVTVAAGATALSAPALGAILGSSGAQTTPTWFRADLRVHQRLAGQDPSFPVTATSLQAAGLLPQTMSSSDAAHVADTIRTLGAAAVKLSPAGGGTQALADACFELDFSQPGRVVRRELSPDAFGTGPAGAVDLGGWFGHIVGDVVHFFKHAADEVETIAVSIADGVASLAINGVAYALKTIDEVVDGIELVLKKVATLFKEAIEIIKMIIEWLRMLFEWDDILRTHTVIKYYVNSVLTNLKNSDQQAVSLIKSEFSALQSKITGAVSQIGTVFGSDSFNDFISRQSGGTSSSLAAQGYRGTFNDHAVRCNYALSKAQHHFAGTTSLATTLVAPVDSGPFANLVSTIQQQVAGLQTSTAKLQSLLRIRTSNPTKLFDLAAVGFLEAAAEIISFVLGVIEDIAIAVLDMVAGAIGTLQDTLNADIDIPIISWLYKYVITGTILDPGDDLTILDLLCLIIAIPATILYKVLFGGADASAPFTSAQVGAITSSPIPWPNLSPAAAAAAPGAMAITPAQEVLLALAAISYFLYAFTDMTTDGYAAAQPGPDPFATFLSLANIVLGVAILGLTVPYEVLGKSEGDWSEADKATLAYWAVSFAPILLAIVFTIFSQAESRFFAIVGPIALSIVGAGVLGIGIWTTIEQALNSSYQNGWTETGNIIAPIPASCAWLLPLADATDGVSVGFLIGIAATCDFGALATTMAGEVTSS